MSAGRATADSFATLVAAVHTPAMSAGFDTQRRARGTPAGDANPQPERRTGCPAQAGLLPPPTVDAGGAGAHEKNCPPFALITEPVMNPASFETRKATQRAISSGSPRRPTGICGMMRSARTFSSMARTMSVPI